MPIRAAENCLSDRQKTAYHAYQYTTGQRDAAALASERHYSAARKELQGLLRLLLPVYHISQRLSSPCVFGGSVGVTDSACFSLDAPRGAAGGRSSPADLRGRGLQRPRGTRRRSGGRPRQARTQSAAGRRRSHAPTAASTGGALARAAPAPPTGAAGRACDRTDGRAAPKKHLVQKLGTRN